MFGRWGVLAVWGVLALMFSAASLRAAEAGEAATRATGPMLLADDSALPHLRVAWTRGDGARVEHEIDLSLTSTDDRTPLGDNLEAFVALGGSRLERGAGHPDGAIVRVGFYKIDRDLLFFDDIANGSSVEIELRNVKFNQDVTPDPATLLQRMRYRVDDVVACGLTIDQSEMFNLASEEDDLGGSILPTQARFASIHIAPADGDGNEPDAAVWVADDGTVSMRAVLPYRLLRHKGDPWALEVPGTFFEPFHFDVEFQVLPRDVAEIEGVELQTAPPAPTQGEQPSDR